MPVNVKPGETALTRMPCGASSDRERAGHADDGGLRGGIGGQVRQADIGEVGAGVDDCATALLDHLAGGVLDRK
jgi:hypothetical protein